TRRSPRSRAPRSRHGRRARCVRDRPMTTYVIVDALVDGRPSHVVWREGIVVDVGEGTGERQAVALAADEVLDADGGEVIPGLHDHHVHLAALAAARSSVAVGPPDVTDGDQLAAALRLAASGGPDWIRAFGYHESVAGDIDAATLDRLVPHSDVSVRVQHRSGQMWVLNSAAIAATGVADLDDDGVERDDDG